jgi:hypothetical protein
MRKLQLTAIVWVSFACRPSAAALGPEALCGLSEPAPASWAEVNVPTSKATLRLPPSYKEAGIGWHGPDSSILRVSMPARRVADSRDPEGTGIVTGPLCRVQLGDRLVALNKWEELPGTGGLWHGTSVTWEETPGADVEIVALARNTKAQLEQIRVLRSIKP